MSPKPVVNISRSLYEDCVYVDIRLDYDLLEDVTARILHDDIQEGQYLAFRVPISMTQINRGYC